MLGAVPSLSSPAQAVSAYGQTAIGNGSSSPGFGDFMSSMVTAAIRQSAATEHAAEAGMMGKGDLTHIVTSVAQAQVALQTTVAVRDRLIQAYQSIMNMPI